MDYGRNLGKCTDWSKGVLLELFDLHVFLYVIHGTLYTMRPNEAFHYV